MISKVSLLGIHQKKKGRKKKRKRKKKSIVEKSLQLQNETKGRTKRSACTHIWLNLHMKCIYIHRVEAMKRIEEKVFTLLGNSNDHTGFSVLSLHIICWVIAMTTPSF